MMLLFRLDPRTGTVVRLLGLAAIVWSLVAARYLPGLSGRGLMVTVMLVIARAAWLTWTLSALRIELARVRRVHELAREGLRETRRVVGVLREDEVSVPAAIETLVAGYRSDSDAPARLRIDGDATRLAGEAGPTALRVVQEALTNARKHGPGAEESVDVHAGDEVVVIVWDRGGAAAHSLARRAEAMGSAACASAPRRSAAA